MLLQPVFVQLMRCLPKRHLQVNLVNYTVVIFECSEHAIFHLHCMFGWMLNVFFNNPSDSYQGMPILSRKESPSPGKIQPHSVRYRQLWMGTGQWISQIQSRFERHSVTGFTLCSNVQCNNVNTLHVRPCACTYQHGHFGTCFYFHGRKCVFHER